MRQEFVSGVWHFATGRGNELAGRNLVANAPPVELLQEVARGVGLCNWVRWEAGDCKVGAGGGDSQERGMEGRSVQKGGGGVWGICRGAGDKSSDQIFCLVQQFFIWEQLFLSPFGSSIWHSVQFVVTHSARCAADCALQTTLRGFHK